NQGGWGSEIPPCGVCGQSVDSTLILDQYGGACPYCIGALPSPAGGEAEENGVEPADNPESPGSKFTPCGVCGQKIDSTLILNQYGGACPYCLGYLHPEGSPPPAPT